MNQNDALPIFGDQLIVECQIDLGDIVICWSPNDGWDRWEGKTVHNLVDGVWNGDKR